MLTRIASLLFAVGALVTSSAAQTGSVDQVSPATNAGFNGDAPSLIWQVEVKAGLTGTLEGFSLTLSGNPGSQLNTSLRMGPGWNTSPVVFSSLITKLTASANEVLFVDTTSAGISVAPGTLFVIELNGNATGMGMGGSYVPPPGTPLYSQDLYLNNPGCFADCGWRIGFTTYVNTIIPP
ncbi:MAG: hypothetical protein ABI054_00925, partial [Planctomycetota bacterium]